MSATTANANAAGTVDQRPGAVTAIPGPRSRGFAERAREALPAGLVPGHRVWARRAGGGIVEDADGNRLVDLATGIGVTTVGASHPDVVAAITRQAEALTHACFPSMAYAPYLELAERLIALAPGDHAKRAALFTTGAEAVENAVKYARAFTGRRGVVVFDHAFHGRTNLTMAMTAKNNPYKMSFGPFASDVHRVPSPYGFRHPHGEHGAAAASMAALELLVDTQAGADTIACVVLEPIQGEGGFIVPPEGFLTQVAEFCRSRGILFIADEVQSGIARTGDMFACDHEGVVPDLMTLAKGIAGGMPLAAVVGRADVMDAAHPGGIGGTYMGNPMACAAALAVLDIIERDGLCGRAREIGERIMGRFTAAQAELPAIGEVRGRGAMCAIELVDADGAPAKDLTARIVAGAEERGVIVLSAGTFGNVIRFLPPLAITDEQLDYALDIIVGIIAAG